MKTALKAIGNWNKDIGVPLNDALAVGMRISGQSGAKACRQAISFMAASASKMAKKAPKNRKVLRDGRKQYVKVWTKSKGEVDVYKWQVENAVDAKPDAWERAKRIWNAGLAKRSWFWGLADFGLPSKSKPIPGVGKGSIIRSSTVNGYQVDNRLDYIAKAMPASWERMVELSASNRIMGQARRVIERQWAKEVGAKKGQKISNADLSQYFTGRFT